VQIGELGLAEQRDEALHISLAFHRHPAPRPGTLPVAADHLTNLRRIALASIVAATATAATAGAAGASVAAHKTDHIDFASHAYLTPQPDGSSRVQLVADTCSIKSDGGAAKPCWLTATGTLHADGTGVAKAVVVTADRVITFDESFVPTGPASGLGSGTVKEIGLGGLKGGTFTAPYQLAPTADPNVLLDWGTITVTH
jgi:hypothetical protein